MVGAGVLTELLRTHKPEDSFYVYELETLQRAYKEWTRVFPTIRPFYAVKCNPDERIVSTLAKLGSGFDCASPSEINLVLNLGVSPDRIIYANPCKRPSDIKFARLKNINRTTFDSVCELQKISMDFPESEVILRIRADDPEARCNLGIKYGAEEKDWEGLIITCGRLHLKLTGVSFHVGSMAKNAQAFCDGLELARKACHLAENHGFKPRLIDIGGGFSSTNVFDLGPVPSAIKTKMGEYFNDDFEFIAEPGRYFAEHVVTLMTPVIGMKGGGITISESLYGAFNCVLFDHADPECTFLNSSGDYENKMIFGSTCDGGDIITKEVKVPLNTGVGDWIIWPRMGAYTSAATTCFNGMAFNERMKIYN
jgi:ornithine decarboxylase